MKISAQSILKSITHLGFTAIGFIFLVQLNNILDNSIQLFTLHLFTLITMSYLSLKYKLLGFTSLDELSWKLLPFSGLFLGIIGGVAYFTVFNFFSIMI